MSKLEQAVRGVAQREALLAEARAELDRALKIGGPGRFTDQVVGSFRLGVLIGRGGMGEVYEAHGVADQREAAVKLLHPGTLAEPTHVAALPARGADRGAARLPARRARARGRHHRAARSRSSRWSGCAATTSRTSCAASAGSQLPQAQACSSIRSRSASRPRAVAGIVHRDLKPHNVFLAEDGGAAALEDPRLRRLASRAAPGTLTKGHVVGTPAYMAPEQARGEDVDHRADVYSLAAIIYRAVTGHPAFTGKDVPTHALRRRLPRADAAVDRSRRCPADVDRVLAIGLAKDPRDRFATALELAAWFAAAVARRARPRPAPPRGRADRAASVGHARSARRSLARSVDDRHRARVMVRVKTATLPHGTHPDPLEPDRRRCVRALSSRRPARARLGSDARSSSRGTPSRRRCELIERVAARRRPRGRRSSTSATTSRRCSTRSSSDQARRVVNLVEFFHDDLEHEHHVPALFELLDIPYTGNRPLALSLCQKKPHAKALLAAAGLPTPRGIVIERRPGARRTSTLRFPLIVKPAFDDASGGIDAGSVVARSRRSSRRASSTCSPSTRWRRWSRSTSRAARSTARSSADRARCRSTRWSSRAASTTRAAAAAHHHVPREVGSVQPRLLRDREPVPGRRSRARGRRARSRTSRCARTARSAAATTRASTCASTRRPASRTSSRSTRTPISPTAARSPSACARAAAPTRRRSARSSRRARAPDRRSATWPTDTLLSEYLAAAAASK